MEISPNAASLLLLMAFCTHPFRAILAYLLPQYAILNDAQRGTPNSIRNFALFRGVFQCYRMHILMRYLMLLSNRSHNPFILPILK